MKQQRSRARSVSRDRPRFGMFVRPKRGDSLGLGWPFTWRRIGGHREDIPLLKGFSSRSRICADEMDTLCKNNELDGEDPSIMDILFSESFGKQSKFLSF